MGRPQAPSAQVILAHLLQGHGPKVIARVLGMDLGTVHRAIYRIRQAHHVRTTAQLICQHYQRQIDAIKEIE